MQIERVCAVAVQHSVFWLYEEIREVGGTVGCVCVCEHNLNLTQSCVL